MIKYGQVIDPSYNPNKNQIYQIFTEYFENPIMTKIKDVGEYSMYISKIHSLLGVEHRYIIVFVHVDSFPVGHSQRLEELRWNSLQTRTIKDEHKLPFHIYKPRRFPPLLEKIYLKSKSHQAYEYECPSYPIRVTLLPQEKTSQEYSNSGNIVIALETYQTIISMT